MIDITKAIELSKNIKNIDEAKELCVWVGDYTNKALIDFLESQQKTIESLKCCGNCTGHKDQGFLTNQCFECSRNKNIPQHKEHTDNWEALK